MTSQFYVYVLRYPDGEPFYVGKGTGSRAYNYGNKFSRAVAAKIARNGGEASVGIIEADDEPHAFELEIELIERFGRRQFGGLLCNLSDGGEGQTGVVWSEERKRRNAETHKGLRQSHEASAKKSAALRKYYAENPEARAEIGRKSRDRQLARYASQDARNVTRDSQLRRYEHQGEHVKSSAGQLRRYENPAERLKSSASARAVWARRRGQA